MNTKRYIFPCVAVLVLAAVVYRPTFSMAQSNLFSQLVQASKAEVEKNGGKLTVGMTWTDRQAKPVLQEFKKEFSFVRDISHSRLRTVEQAQRMLMEYKAGRAPDIDIPDISSELWPEYFKEGLFLKPRYDYKELIKSLPKDWPAPDPRVLDPEGRYIASTGSARGIAYNKNLIPPDKAPKGWQDCLDPRWKGSITYDSRSRLTAFQHDPKTREWFLKWVKGLVENKVVINRGMEESLEKVVAGEYHISCVTNYHHAIPMIDEGAPLVFFFPDPFTLDISTELLVVKWSKTPATTQLLSLWLATKAQPLVETVSHRGFPWIPTSRKYPMTRGKYMAVCGSDCDIKADHYNEEHARILGLPGAR
jgi:ABC-type Fe3+ transport system substrate-binding protein